MSLTVLTIGLAVSLALLGIAFYRWARGLPDQETPDLSPGEKQKIEEIKSFKTGSVSRG